jgi:diguanylate cyclase (GGDEF)-like protein
MIDPRATLDELAGALDAAGVGVYLYEGARGEQRRLFGGPDSGVENLSDADGDDARRPVELAAGPRFHGVVRVRPDIEAAPASRDGRAGLQAHLTHLSETLPPDETVAICAIGIDGLREFNRVYGYDSGDQLSLGVGARLARTLPEGAALARVGGAKFAAVLPGADAGAFREHAERLGAEIRSVPFDVGFGPLTVTVSIGAAVARAPALASPDPSTPRWPRSTRRASKANKGFTWRIRTATNRPCRPAPCAPARRR